MLCWCTCYKAMAACSGVGGGGSWRACYLALGAWCLWAEQHAACSPASRAACRLLAYSTAPHPTLGWRMEPAPNIAPVRYIRHMGPAPHAARRQAGRGMQAGVCRGGGGGGVPRVARLVRLAAHGASRAALGPAWHSAHRTPFAALGPHTAAPQCSARVTARPATQQPPCRVRHARAAGPHSPIGAHRTLLSCCTLQGAPCSSPSCSCMLLSSAAGWRCGRTPRMLLTRTGHHQCC